MKSSAFQYHRPETAADAAALLGELGDGAKVLAGGQSLIPMLALRVAAFEHLVDIGRVGDLVGIERRNECVRVGAATTQATIEHSVEIARSVPLLARSTPLIGHFQIRNRGTIGGSIAHADPAAEYPAVALALDARIEVLSPRGSREISADAFFNGWFTTSMAPDELLTGVAFPVWSGRCGFAVREFARRTGDFAVAGAVVALALDDDERVLQCAISLFGMGPTPRRAPSTEAAATGVAAGDLSAEEIGHNAVAELSAVPSDLHGSSSYRSRVGAAMVTRAWAAAQEEALHA